MADGTKIEWSDMTWNVITGCTVLSAGCKRCYAMRLAGTRLRNHHSREGLTVATSAGPVWNGKVRFNDCWLLDPLRKRRPRLIFLNAHGDTWHEDVREEWIDQTLAVVALSPQHIIQSLTKRSARMRAYLNDPATPGRIIAAVEQLHRAGAIDRKTFERFALVWPLPNLFAGVSVENQRWADERIPDLLASPAAVRWLSCEPLLGPIDLTNIAGNMPEYGDKRAHGTDVLTPHNMILRPQIDCVVTGGESGPGSRVMLKEWPRQIRDHCAAAGVFFDFKQWGEWAPTRIVGTSIEILGARSMTRYGKKAAGRLLDGVQHDGMRDLAKRVMHERTEARA